jgi:uncharacterized membrane protein
MLKKSLIASVLAIATFAAYAQAPMSTALSVSPGNVTSPATQTNGSKAKREALRKMLMEERNASRQVKKAKIEAAKVKLDVMKAKHEAEKAKRDEVKAAHTKEKAKKAVKKIAA